MKTYKKPSEFSAATAKSLGNIIRPELLQIIANSPEVLFTDTQEGYTVKLIQLAGSEFDIVLKEGDIAVNAINLNYNGENEYSSGAPGVLGVNVDARHVFYICNQEVFRINQLGQFVHINMPVFADNATAVSAGLSVGTEYVDNTGELRIVKAVNPVLTNQTQLTINNGDPLPVGVEPDILFIDTGIVAADTEYIVAPINKYYLVGLYYARFGDGDEDGFNVTNHSDMIYSTTAVSVNGRIQYSPINGGLVGYSTASELILLSLNIGFRAVLKFEKYPI